ncbi:MAG: response regulator [Magnetococcales bacterium]|nr:response regulator [Magnetococcales bacterium]
MMRIDYLVKDSFPQLGSIQEVSHLLGDPFGEGYVVVVEEGVFAGIHSFPHGKKAEPLPLTARIQLGEEVDAVSLRMEKGGYPALPVFDQQQFIGIVTRSILKQFKADLHHALSQDKINAKVLALSDENITLQAELRDLRSWTERANHSRMVSCALMRTSLEPLSLSEQLGVALDLIFSVPWLSVQARGTLFLAEEDGTLHLAVHRGMSETLLTTCKQVAPGFCLCGRAAATRKPVFSGTIDHRHEVTYEGMQPHGHYCYPILSNDRLLGVINLYLAEDHVRDPEEEDFLLSITNILAGLIERKQVEDALIKAKVEAENASLAKTSFLANVSHEIRTPLNAIVGFSRILLKHRSQISPRFLQYLENIRVSGVSLTEIINNVLDLAKIEAGKVETEVEDVDIRLLVQSLYQISKDRAAEKGVRVHYDIDPDLPRKVQTDRTRLNQILINLVDNAIKFTGKGKEVTLRVLLEGQEMLFQIEDQGVGIPPDRLQAVFQPFEQADSSTTRQHGGTGLGLAIVKSLVEILGGSVSALSEVDVGSIFTVRLPLHAVAGQEKVVEETNWLSYTFRPGVKILLVEDNPMNQEMLMAVLEEAGLTAKIAENGQVGVALALSWRPDLIFMDLHMPVMDGMDASRAIRQHPELLDLPIIGLSADAFVGLEGQAREAGISHFLTKPVDLDRLMPLMHQYLGTSAGDGESQGERKTAIPDEIAQKRAEGLRQIAALPPFESGKIVALCDTLIEQCSNYEAAQAEVFEQIREAVYSRNSKRIPGLVQQALKG